MRQDYKMHGLNVTLVSTFHCIRAPFICSLLHTLRPCIDPVMSTAVCDA